MTLLVLSIMVLNCICENVYSVPIALAKGTFTNPDKQDNNDLNADASTYYLTHHSARASKNNYPDSYDNSITGYGLIEDETHNPYDTVLKPTNYYQDINYVGNNDDYNGYRTHHIQGGNGGYGGLGGNGGLNSYYGYNRPNYQDAQHLGYGYYHTRQGYGNIYNSGITPNLVTGYRGYS